MVDQALDPDTALEASRQSRTRSLPSGDLRGAAAIGYADQQRILADMRAKGLFFVGGLPKSGTAWLQIMLNAHPEVSCAGEGHLLTSLAPLLESAMKQHNVFISRKNREVLPEFSTFPQFTETNIGFLFVSAALLLLAASDKAQDARVVGEKTPENAANLWFLADHFPTAKFIHILRDPRDCTVSAWFHNQRIDARAAQDRRFTLSALLPQVVQSWCDTLADWESFAEVAPARCAMVRYEDLVVRPHEEMARLFEFLQVSSRAATVDDCVAAGEFSRLSGGRAAGVEDRGSLLRRGLPGDWRHHLAQGDELLCRCMAGNVMARLGYVV
jgi:Sulfotransferase family